MSLLGGQNFAFSNVSMAPLADIGRVPRILKQSPMGTGHFAPTFWTKNHSEIDKEFDMNGLVTQPRRRQATRRTAILGNHLPAGAP